MAGLKIILRIVGLILCGLLVSCMAVWGALALHYSDLQSNALQDIFATAFALCGLLALAALVARRWQYRALGAFVVLFAGLLTWWTHASHELHGQYLAARTRESGTRTVLVEDPAERPCPGISA